jgi:predicted glutamine amidotransferase
MCRLFGILASEPTSARFWLLGASDSMLDQSYRHPDGTGLAYYAGRRAVLEKHPIAAHKDQEFATEARSASSHLFVAHIRHATRGKPSLENTQPFSQDSLVFVHNGTVENLEDLADPLGPFSGDTDSERYFAVLRHHIGKASNTLTGIRKAVGWIKKNCTYTSLNFLLADGDCLYALRLPGTRDFCLYTRRLGAEEDFRGLSSYGTRTESRHRSGATLFASEQIDSAPSWRELEPGTLAVAHRDLRLDFHYI